MRRWWLIGILFLTLSTASFAVYVLFWKPQSGAAAKTVIIPRGAGIIRIAALLREEGLLQQPQTFRLAAKILGYEKKLKAGKYLIPANASNIEILRILYQGRPYEESVTIPEGVTARKIASILARKVNIDSSAFMQTVFDSSWARQLGVPAPALEGYLFPDTYRFYWGISPEEVTRIMVRQFFAQLPDSAEERAQELGFSLHEVVTLASIIEGEAVIDSERATISAVYHNRLKRGMLLQADPTIQYIIPDGPRRLLKRDLQIDSPYNTYKYRGLPPGPINNPGRESIIAALYPADVPYLYFVARGDGSHIFSTTYAQHLRAKRAFDRIRRQVAKQKKKQAKRGQ